MGAGVNGQGAGVLARRNIAHKVGLLDLHRIGGIAASGQAEAAAGAWGPAAATVAAVLPATALFQAPHGHAADVADPVTFAATAVAAQAQGGRVDGLVNDEGRELSGWSGVACCIDLPDLDLVFRITDRFIGLAQDEAAALAIGPAIAFIGAVLPGGACFQAGHRHGAQVGDAIVAAARVAEADARVCRGRLVNDKGHRVLDQDLKATGDLLDLNLANVIRALGERETAGICPRDPFAASIGRVFPGRPGIPFLQIDGAVIADAVAVGCTGVIGQLEGLLGGGAFAIVILEGLLGGGAFAIVI